MHCNQLQFNQMANALTFKCNAVYNKAHCNKIDNWNYKIHCMSPLWPNIESENTVLYCCTFIQECFAELIFTVLQWCFAVLYCCTFIQGTTVFLDFFQGSLAPGRAWFPPFSKIYLLLVHSQLLILSFSPLMPTSWSMMSDHDDH